MKPDSLEFYHLAGRATQRQHKSRGDASIKTRSRTATARGGFENIPLSYGNEMPPRRSGCKWFNEEHSGKYLKNYI